jgi:predicted alpha/beta hydrolase
MTDGTTGAGPRVHRIAAPDETTLGVEEYGVASETGRATVVFLPAMGVPLAYYRPMLQHWAGRPRHLVGLEWRGMPQSPVTDIRRQTYGYSHLLRHDLPAVLGLDQIPDRFVLVGHSMGGQLALLATASGRAHPAAVATIATGTSSALPHFHLHHRIGRHLGMNVINTIARALGYWPGHRLRFGGRQPRTLMRDFTFEARHGRYRLQHDDTDYESALARLSTPALLMTIEHDRLIPATAVDHLARRLPPTVARATVDTTPVRDHFLWARRQPRPVVAALETWLTTLDL